MDIVGGVVGVPACHPVAGQQIGPVRVAMFDKE